VWWPDIEGPFWGTFDVGTGGSIILGATQASFATGFHPLRRKILHWDESIEILIEALGLA
jgi:hypothetical protein